MSKKKETNNEEKKPAKKSSSKSSTKNNKTKSKKIKSESSTEKKSPINKKTSSSKSNTSKKNDSKKSTKAKSNQRNNKKNTTENKSVSNKKSKNSEKSSSNSNTIKKNNTKKSKATKKSVKKKSDPINKEAEKSNNKKTANKSKSKDSSSKSASPKRNTKSNNSNKPAQNRKNTKSSKVKSTKKDNKKKKEIADVDKGDKTKNNNSNSSGNKQNKNRKNTNKSNSKSSNSKKSSKSSNKKVANKNKSQNSNKSQNTQKKNSNRNEKEKPKNKEKSKKTPNKKPKSSFKLNRIKKKALANYEKDNYLKNFYDRFKQIYFNELMLEKEASILVGVSGGVDSVTLLDILANLHEELKINIYISHLNHQIRDEAEDDEKLIRKLGDKYGIQTFIKSEDIKSISKSYNQSLELAGRNRRYKLFEEIVNRNNIDFLSTAHTKNDQAETFLFNLMRGSGLSGLTSIPAKRNFAKKSTLIRPLLHFSKEELIEYATKRNLEWNEDATNHTLDYSRNKLRNKYIPELQRDFNPKLIDSIYRTIKILSGAEEFISEYVMNNFKKVFVNAERDRVEINIQFLKTFPEFLQNEFVRMTLDRYFNINNISMDLTERIINLTNSKVSSIIEINDRVNVLKDRSSLIISRTSKNEEQEVNEIIKNVGTYSLGGYKFKLSIIPRKEVKFTTDRNVEYFDADFLPQMLKVRKWRPGDTFRPLGLDGSMKVSDFLTNEKIPLVDKEKILVLTDKLNIIWIMGMRISDEYAVRKNSKNVLKAEIFKSPVSKNN